MKQVCKELIDFFNNSEGWDKQGLIDEFIEKVLSEDLGIKDTNINFVTCDNRDENVFLLESFAEYFFDRVIEGVCNVIKTA